MTLCWAFRAAGQRPWRCSGRCSGGRCRLDAVREPRDRHPEGPRDPGDIDQGQVALAALDPAQVGGVKAGLEGELLLGEVALLAEAPHTATESRQDLALSRGHLDSKRKGLLGSIHRL